jgi:hypothetical protein
MHNNNNNNIIYHINIYYFIYKLGYEAHLILIIYGLLILNYLL